MFSLSLHPHFIFEALAYFVGFRIYAWQKRRQPDPLENSDRLAVIAAAVLGAALGSKILYWFCDPGLTWQNRNNFYYLMSGKTIVGALIGGLFAVELAKKCMGVTARSGDLFALPLAIGIAIGRVGCFLSGLEDRTYGIATRLPWGVDLGDGILRHPVQIYEIIFLLILAFYLLQRQRQSHRQGDLFKIFMTSYFTFRLLIDFLKPEVKFAGLSILQWSCIAMLLYYAKDLTHLFFKKELSQA